MYRSAMNDPQVTVDRMALVPEISRLMLDLNLADKSLTKPTIHAVGNVTVANEQLGLPKQGKTALWALTNATQTSEGKHLTDWTPIMNPSVDGNHVYTKPNPARETYIAANLLAAIEENGFDITSHPEMFTGVNGQVIVNAFRMFEEPYGIGYAEMEKGRELTPSNSSAADVMALQFDLYSSFSPQRGGGNLTYNRDFPWYDGTQLRAIYANDTNAMRAALFKLFYLPTGTFSIQGQERVRGLEAARVSLTDAYDRYMKILYLYPNGTKPFSDLGEFDPRLSYFGWLGDRWGWGLNYTIGEHYLGMEPNALEEIKTWMELGEICMNNSGVEGYLNRNWEYWDLVRFIIGYERGTLGHGGEHLGMIIRDSILRMAGFPTYTLIITPRPMGTAGGEVTICLPPTVYKDLREQYPNANILFGSGYDIGPYSMGNGLVKERGIASDPGHTPIDNGIMEVWQWYGMEKAYLMKRK